LFTLPFFLLSLLPLSPRPSLHAFTLQSYYDVDNEGDSDGGVVDHLDEEDNDMMMQNHAKQTKINKKCQPAKKKSQKKTGVPPPLPCLCGFSVSCICSVSSVSLFPCFSASSACSFSTFLPFVVVLCFSYFFDLSPVLLRRWK